MATTQQQERWLIEGQLAGAKQALDVADITFQMGQDGHIDDEVIGKMLNCLEDLHRAITQIDTRLQRLEGEH